MYVSLAIYIRNNAEKDSKVPSDVILVLGARVYISGAYNPCLKARVDHAVTLYKHKFAPKILMSGGNDKEDNANEAETMKKIAIEEGVKPEDILLEKKSSSTYENIMFSKKLFEAKNLQSVIIVTEPFHIPRASLVAKKAALSFTVSPAIDSPCWTHHTYLSKYFLKEPLAILGYKLQKKL